MNIVFLDVDGVLNNDKSAVRFAMSRDPNHIDFDNLKKFYEIFKVSKPRIVLSSFWRLDTYDKLKLNHALTMAGIPEIQHETPYMAGRPRGEEISAWLDLQPVDVPLKCLVLDDDKDAMPTRRGPHKVLFIRVNPYTGLTDKEVAEAINFFQSA